MAKIIIAFAYLFFSTSAVHAAVPCSSAWITNTLTQWSSDKDRAYCIICANCPKSKYCARCKSEKSASKTKKNEHGGE